ncbi:uncharacterized protein LOC110455571 isoform X2 [Mizuhopecten yessoensis]|uniref:uncharacterized protein LOC110455571 isoform X2 n=1 Tax=Mizuhopecten yessoensis TaxID=6573 RepID=UPI000B45CCD4|nr:uncharacterized protein LOC110455571 isoform X2 [Mizuhopecten yessoensis]
MAEQATCINVLLGSITFAVLFSYCACAEGNTQNFRCYTASKPCTRGVKMARMKECFKYRGRCMERIYPENVTQCCPGYVGKHCDNYLKDEFYFASSMAGDDVGFIQRRALRITQDRRGPKGEKGDIGPEGFIGMPGQKGDPGMPAEKGQKGKPGISKKGERGREGRKGKTGRRGRKGDIGPMGPAGTPWLPGLSGPRGISKTDCNCSDLVTRVEDLENLVRGILDGRVALPPAHQPPRRQAQEFPTADRLQQAGRGSQRSDSVLTPSVTTETTTLIGRGEESEANMTTLPSGELTEYQTESTETPTTIPDQDVITVEETAAVLTASPEPPYKCNHSYTISDCHAGSLCKMSAPVFIKIPPPHPNNTDLSRTYLNRLSCCSSETLDFAFLYYKNQYMLK